MLDDFLMRAILGGIGVAVIAGPLGCFVVWRRMAYFGNALAHSALLGVGLGALLSLDLTLATVAVCLLLALLLVLLDQQRGLATDTILGILAHAALALGLVVLAFMEFLRVDLMAYLFGDVLAVTRRDLLWIWGGGALVLGALLALWSSLLRVTLDEELATAEGVPTRAVRLAFMLLMALAVAIGMKIVGILLIVAMLVIPRLRPGSSPAPRSRWPGLRCWPGSWRCSPASAHRWSGTPRRAPQSWSPRRRCS